MPTKNTKTGEIYGVFVYVMDDIFWLVVADGCDIPDNKDWQQKYPFESSCGLPELLTSWKTNSSKRTHHHKVHKLVFLLGF